MIPSVKKPLTDHERDYLGPVRVQALSRARSSFRGYPPTSHGHDQLTGAHSPMNHGRDQVPARTPPIRNLLVFTLLKPFLVTFKSFLHCFIHSKPPLQLNTT